MARRACRRRECRPGSAPGTSCNPTRCYIAATNPLPLAALEIVRRRGVVRPWLTPPPATRRWAGPYATGPPVETGATSGSRRSRSRRAERPGPSPTLGRTRSSRSRRTRPSRTPRRGPLRSGSTSTLRYRAMPVPAGMSLPMMTFSLRPSSESLLARDRRVGEHPGRLLEGGRRQPRLGRQRRLGDAHQHRTAGRRLAALGHHPTVLAPRTAPARPASRAGTRSRRTRSP